MKPKTRSFLLSLIGGMMAASLLNSEGVVDLSFGFPRGGLFEGVFIAVAGSLAGCIALLAFRKIRAVRHRNTG